MLYLRPPLCPLFNLFFVAVCISLRLDVLDLGELLKDAAKFKLADVVLLDQLDVDCQFAVS